MAERTRSQVVAFRVTKAERRQIEGKVRKSGLSQQAYLLQAALEEELRPILAELRGWGRNLNQLTVLAHSGGCRRCTCGNAWRCWARPTRR